MKLPGLLDRLDGPPLALPGALDAASERYWRLGPRLRGATAVVVVAVVLLASGLAGGSRWGGPVDVLVAARTLPAGHVLGGDDIRQVRWPEGIGPPDAVTEPVEGTLIGVLPEGAVLTESHLGRGGRGALVSEGRAAVALPLDLLAEHTVGAVIDVVGTDGHGGAVTLTHTARVLAADEDHVWIEVDRTDAAAVAAAGRDRSAIAVVHPP